MSQEDKRRRMVVAALAALVLIVAGPVQAALPDVFTGEKIFLAQNEGTEQRIQGFNLSQPFDPRDRTKTGDLLVTDSIGKLASGMDWKRDGSRFYVIDDGDNELVQFDTETPWQVDNASRAGNFSLGGGDDIEITTDGELMYVLLGGAEDEIQQFELTVSHDITSASKLDGVCPLSDGGQGFVLRPGGEEMLFMRSPSQGTTDVERRELPTAFDVSTCQNAITGNYGGRGTDMEVDDDGDRLFLANDSGELSVYDLAAPYDPTTQSFVRNVDFTNELVVGNFWGFSWGEGVTPPPEGPRPVDFFEGLDQFIEGLGFKSGESKFFFSLAVIGLAMVVAATSTRWVRSGEWKNWMIAGTGMIVGVFTVLLGYVELWEYLIAVVLGGVAIQAGPESVKNTLAELREEFERTVQDEPKGFEMAEAQEGVEAESARQRLERQGRVLEEELDELREELGERTEEQDEELEVDEEPREVEDVKPVPGAAEAEELEPPEPVSESEVETESGSEGMEDS